MLHVLQDSRPYCLQKSLLTSKTWLATKYNYRIKAHNVVVDGRRVDDNTTTTDSTEPADDKTKILSTTCM